MHSDEFGDRIYFLAFPSEYGDFQGKIAIVPSDVTNVNILSVADAGTNSNSTELLAQYEQHVRERKKKKEKKKKER